MERFLSFYSLFKIVLVILVPLPFYIHFKITLSRSKKFLLSFFFFFKGIALNLCISLEKIDIFIILSFPIHEWGFPGGSMVKNLSAKAGDASLIPSGRCPGEGNGNPLHCSWLGNPMDRGAWWATVCGVTKSLIWIGN